MWQQNPKKMVAPAAEKMVAPAPETMVNPGTEKRVPREPEEMLAAAQKKMATPASEKMVAAGALENGGQSAQGNGDRRQALYWIVRTNWIMSTPIKYLTI